jgi:hypothetical protein
MIDIFKLVDMVLKFLCILIGVTFLFNTAFSQNLFFGKILDSLNSNPVSFAVVRTNASGTYCDSAGNFIMKGILDDSAYISCVGFKEKKVAIQKDKENLIFLTPIYNNLTPIVLGDYDWLKNPSKQLGRLEGVSKFSVFIPASGLTIVKYFPHPNQINEYIISEMVVRIGVSPTLYRPRKLRVRIFEAKNPYTIGDDLLNYPDIFLLNKLKGNLAYLDLNSFAFQMPLKGCFIGFEFVGGDDSAMDSNDKLNIKGWLSKDFEDGIVFSKYFSNSFHEFTFGSKQKVNLYFSINLFETK